jgi:hypothetical protein
MNPKTLLLVPAALALCAPGTAQAHWGFGLNLSVPLYYPADGYYYPSAGYVQTVSYAAPTAVEGEQVPPAPGAGYVWMAGHWNNVAQKWVWVAGHWEMPPSPSAVWVAGHWVQANTGWVWVDGAWTVGSSSAQAAGGPPAAPMTPPSAAPAQAVPAPAAPATPPPLVSADVAEGTVVAAEPPAPIVEYVPAAPYPDYVWIGGYWGWRAGWYWVPGRYAHAPYRGAAWVSGGWARGASGWAFHGGRWR